MKAVIFDFNGTLYNDTNLHRTAWHSYLAERFGLELSMDEIDRVCIGPPNEAIFRTLIDKNMPMADIISFSREKEAMYRQAALATEETRRLIDGVPEMLDMLTRRGVPFALATASLMDNVEFYLNDLGLGKWFTLDRVVYEDGTRPGKPDPAFYLEAARRLNVSPADCIIVEDSRTGFRAAKAAGAGRTIAMDTTTPVEMLRAMPEIYAVIHDYYGFERFLENT